MSEVSYLVMIYLVILQPHWGSTISFGEASLIVWWC